MSPRATSLSTATGSTQEHVTPDVQINFAPSGVDVRGEQDVRRSFQEPFTSRNPPSLRFRLLTRTIDEDQAVAEMVTLSKHTTEKAWMVPGIKATHKDVFVVMVLVARFRGVWFVTSTYTGI